ncbi:MAG: hypothetical protein QW514_00110 [Thermoprotei archaeon]
MDDLRDVQDPELLHDWFDGVISSVFVVFGSSSKRVVEMLEGLVGHRCEWLLKTNELRDTMRNLFGLVGDVLVTQLFEEAVKQSYKLEGNQRYVVLKMLGVRIGSAQNRKMGDE